MASTRAAQRYAKALLSLAQENNKTEAIYNSIQDIAKTLRQSKELRNVLKSPVVKPSAKKGVLKAVFKDVDSTVINLFDVLVDNNRINHLEAVAVSFIALYDEIANIKVAHVVTAEALTPETEAKLLAKVKTLTGSEASLKSLIDKSILGGFVLRIGDIQYDASLSGKLNKLKKKFKNNAYA